MCDPRGPERLREYIIGRDGPWKIAISSHLASTTLGLRFPTRDAIRTEPALLLLLRRRARKRMHVAFASSTALRSFRRNAAARVLPHVGARNLFFRVVNRDAARDNPLVTRRVNLRALAHSVAGLHTPPRPSPLPPLRSSPRASAAVARFADRHARAAAAKRILLVDDVLDWLSDKGGYTGFTEEQLRSGEDLREQVDMDSFGEGTKVDNATTDAFVIFLVLLPLIVIVGAVKVFDLDTCWRGFC